MIIINYRPSPPKNQSHQFLPSPTWGNCLLSTWAPAIPTADFEQNIENILNSPLMRGIIVGKKDFHKPLIKTMNPQNPSRLIR